MKSKHLFCVPDKFTSAQHFVRGQAMRLSPMCDSDTKCHGPQTIRLWCVCLDIKQKQRDCISRGMRFCLGGRSAQARRTKNGDPLAEVWEVGRQLAIETLRLVKSRDLV